MAHVAKITRNFYRDSVALMQLSSRLSAVEGIQQASAVMASTNNLALLREAGLLKDDIDAGPNDLLIALAGDDAAVHLAIAQAEDALNQKPPSESDAGRRRETRDEAVRRRGVDLDAR